MKSSFLNSVKVNKPKGNVFDLSHMHLTTCNAGVLVPIYVEDCVPGDSPVVGQDALVRLTPLATAMYARLKIYMHTWAVPYRLLTEDPQLMEKWFTGSADGSPTPDSVAFPTLDIAGTGSGVNAWIVGGLSDYLGMPFPAVPAPVDEKIVAVFHSAYQFIVNENYRDQNLEATIDYKLTEGDNSGNGDLFALRVRAWERDYLTGGLPFAQKGAPVQIPVAGEFPDSAVYKNASVPADISEAWATGLSGGGASVANVLRSGTTDPDVPAEFLYVKTSDLVLTATTISDLRQAYALQRYLELSARGGTRYIEWIRAMFGVKSSDARLNRPEYISGSITPVITSEVLQTSSSNGTPQGNMAGHGIAAVDGRHQRYYCEEHTVIMTIMSIMPDAVYTNGIPKMFTKWRNREQYLNPIFANLSEQAVEQREVMAYQDPAIGDEAFCYQPIYSEYRLRNSYVSGQFRTTLRNWVMLRQFNGADAPIPFNEDFVKCIAPDYSPFAITDSDEHHFYCHIINRVKARRLLPYFGTPMP